MEQFPGHKCQLALGSRTYLPKLLPTASWWQKLVQEFRKSLIVSMKNPMTARYFKSQGAIAREHRRQAKLPYMVIHPCSHFLAYWRVIVLVAFSIYLIIVPFQIAFHDKLPDPNIPNLTLQLTVTIILYLEILVKFYSGYYDKANEMYILNRTMIRQKYLRTTFFLDIISSFPGLLVLRLFSDFGNMNSFATTCLYILFFCFLLSFCNIPKFIQYYQIISVHYDFGARTDLIIKLGLLNLYIIHLATLFCEIIQSLGEFLETDPFLFSSAIVSSFDLRLLSNYDDTSDLDNARDESPFYIYARQFLYTLDGFIGCGYVDLNPKKEIYKKDVSTFVMLCGWIGKAFIIIILTQTIMSHDRASTLYEAFVHDVKDYCKKFKLPDDLAANIFMYIEYKFRFNYFNEDHIFRTLSPRLKAQIRMDQCKQLVEQVEIFKNLSSSKIKNIISCLKLEIYLPGQSIIRADDAGTKMFFLETGSAMVLSQSGTEITTFRDGSYFGEIALVVTDNSRTASVIAVEVCETYSLSKADFFNVIEPNAEVLAQMQQIALQRIEDNIRTSR